MKPLDMIATWMKTALWGSLLIAVAFPFYLLFSYRDVSTDELITAPPLVFLMTIVPYILFSLPYITLMCIYVYRLYDSGLSPGKVYRNIVMAHALLSVLTCALFVMALWAVDEPLELAVIPLVVYTAVGGWVLHHRIKKTVH